jgi:cysteine desulfurase/selenocysteine lyase
VNTQSVSNRRVVYLDNASTAWPKPESVYRHMTDSYRRIGVSPGRGGFELAREAGALLGGLRERLTRFFGGDTDAPERLCFGYNATDALNLIIPGLLQGGDHLVTSTLEHNTVLRPIHHLVRDGGVAATFVRFGAAGVIDPEDVAQAIQPNTRLVIITHGSNVIGTVQPAEEIGAICRERGVVFAVDASQTAGAIPINMRKMHIGALAFTGHKAMMGSMGIGGLCVRRRVDIRSVRSGGTGVRSEDPFQVEEYPWRLEFGTPNMVGVAALAAGQDWIEENGLENLRAREMALAAMLVNGLRHIPGVHLYACDDLRNHTPTVSLNIEGVEAGDAGARLEAGYGVITRTGLHCAPRVHEQLGTLATGGTIRFSIGPFNTEEDVQTAVRGVGEVALRARSRSRVNVVVATQNPRLDTSNHGPCGAGAHACGLDTRVQATTCADRSVRAAD